MNNLSSIVKEDLIAKCMRCGLCLPSCPTYVITGVEKSSPRGRIRLMKGVVEGDIGITKGFMDEMSFCLDCQACETACPAGVKFGSLIESARELISRGKHEAWYRRLFKRLVLRGLFERPRVLTWFGRLLRFYQESGLDRFIKNSGLLRTISPQLHEIQFLIPRARENTSSEPLRISRLLQRNNIQRVGFLTGCVMDVFYRHVNQDTVRLLAHHGCEVVIPPLQVCCGSLLAHNGDLAAARRLARKNVEVFANLNLDSIVMNSAGCGAFMKDYANLLSDDPEYSERAAEIASKIKDISEFLDKIGLRIDDAPSQEYEPVRVTYQDACHLVHSQGIKDEPRRLIRSVPMTEYVELPESTWCCGSAGIYNITHYDTASKLLQRKVDNIKKTRTQIVITGNPGCLMQLEYGLRRDDMRVEVVHLATFLRRACCG